MKHYINTYVIDLFCGAGGTSTAIFKSNTSIQVVACINHDKNAIISHSENYPNCLHLTEDIRTAALDSIKETIEKLQEKDPLSRVAIWASLECTNYSRAKGGLPRDADSRTLAEHLFRYFDVFDPDFIWIENVREFMAWGPLDENGKPESRNKGKDYLSWINRIQDRGYSFDWKLLNSANYGGYTTRTRYFAQFSKDKFEISFPEASHEKSPQKEGFFTDAKKPWNPVKHVLDLEDEGLSIFERKKPLVEATLKRIYAGLMKFIAKGDESFLKKYFSGDPKNKVISTNGPAGTITTIDHHAFVNCNFLTTYYGNGGVNSENEPSPTVTTKDRISKISAQFLMNYFSSGGELNSIDGPHPSITTVPKSRLIETNFIDNQYGNSKPQSIKKPCSTITANPKQALVWIYNNNSSTAPSRSINGPAPTITQRTHYLLNPQYASKGSSVDNPCFTLIARMDKAPPYLMEAEPGQIAIAVFESDSETTIKIKQFMAAYGIIDIKMRMLKIPELLQIQGFPKDYKLVGTQTEQKKYIGNSVEVNVGVALFKAIDIKIQKYETR